MDRLVLFVIALVAQVGCQTPYYPFGVPQTRVPPPPTGVIGDGDYYQDSNGYSAPYSNPQVPYQGSQYIPPIQVPGEQITDVGPWRYWESATERSLDNSGSPSRTSVARNVRPIGNQQTAQVSLVAANQNAANQNAPPVGLTKNDQLSWKEPYRDVPKYWGSESSYTDFVRQDIPVAQPASRTIPASNLPVGSGYQPPRLLPSTGPVTPIVSNPVRVRGFPNGTSRREVAVLPEVRQQLQSGVRQASTWEARYDDVRR